MEKIMIAIDNLEVIDLQFSWKKPYQWPVIMLPKMGHSLGGL